MFTPEMMQAFAPPQLDAESNKFFKVLAMQTIASCTMKKIQTQRNPNANFLVGDIVKGAGSIAGIGAGMDLTQLVGLMAMFGGQQGKAKEAEVVEDKTVFNKEQEDYLDAKFASQLTAIKKIVKTK